VIRSGSGISARIAYSLMNDQMDVLISQPTIGISIMKRHLSPQHRIHVTGMLIGCLLMLFSSITLAETDKTTESHPAPVYGPGMMMGGGFARGGYGFGSNMMWNGGNGCGGYGPGWMGTALE
jgi:hypothetical protein